MKLNSLKVELKRTQSKIFNLQETHFSRKGKFQMLDWHIFETIRKKEHGSMVGVHVDLDPVLISEHNEDFEMLVVQVKTVTKEIRLISGYGPQETQTPDQRMPFFSKLEEEIVSAKLAKKSVIIQADANSKLGKEFIPNDPHPQSPNGEVLAAIIKRNALVVVNSLEGKCKGLITRKRITEDGIEESVIDFLIVSQDLVEQVE